MGCRKRNSTLNSRTNSPLQTCSTASTLKIMHTSLRITLSHSRAERASRMLTATGTPLRVDRARPDVGKAAISTTKSRVSQRVGIHHHPLHIGLKVHCFLIQTLFSHDAPGSNDWAWPRVGKTKVITSKSSSITKSGSVHRIMKQLSIRKTSHSPSSAAQSQQSVCSTSAASHAAPSCRGCTRSLLLLPPHGPLVGGYVHCGSVRQLLRQIRLSVPVTFSPVHLCHV